MCAPWAMVARVSPNGQWVASGDVSGRVRVWGLNDDLTLKAEHQPLSGAIDDIAWSDDGQRIVACGDGKGTFAKAFLWDTGNTVGRGVKRGGAALAPHLVASTSAAFGTEH